MRRWIVGVSALLCLGASAFGQGAADVRLDLVTYKQLGDEIKRLHGKVVLVDFWADYCAPCKQKFPQVLAMHKKFAAAGLAVVSVSVDDVADPETRERVKEFLLRQGSTCRNLLLAERPEVWVPKLKMNSIPAMFLFDREGRLVNRWTGDGLSLPVVEKRVAEIVNAELK
jgi:thiol-disulfide isomerase/thioredoxin